MAYKQKHKVHLYYSSYVGDGVYQSKVCSMEPSSIQMDYIDVMGNKTKWKQTFYEDKLYKKDVKYKKGKKKGKIKHKKGSVEKANVKRNYNLTGTSSTDYLKGYHTKITITFKCLTESQLRTIMRASRQKYSQLLTFKATYKDINGQKQTEEYQNTYWMDKIQLAFYEPTCCCFCKTWFSMADISFATSYKNPKTHQFIYEDVTLTFRTIYERGPRSFWSGLSKGKYYWQDTTTSKWRKDKAPAHKTGYV